MALPTLPDAPITPSREQGEDAFDKNVPAFLAWMDAFRDQLEVFKDALPAEVYAMINAAIAAYDPDRSYSAAMVDALFAAQEKRIEGDSYFFNVTS